MPSAVQTTGEHGNAGLVAELFVHGDLPPVIADG